MKSYKTLITDLVIVFIIKLRGMELTVIVVNDLEILDRGLSDSAVEVKNVGLCVVVPHRRLVVKFNHAFRVFVLPPGQQRLMVL